MLCPRLCGVETEGAGVREAVKDICAGAESADGPAVLLLIEEEAGLLAVFHVDIIADSVFRDEDVGIERFGEESLRPLESFLLADLCVTPLIDAADIDPVLRKHFHERLENKPLEPICAERE